jgi:hypothetical protein
MQEKEKPGAANHWITCIVVGLVLSLIPIGMSFTNTAVTPNHKPPSLKTGNQ